MQLAGLFRSHGNVEINTRQCRIACTNSESGVPPHIIRCVTCLLQVRDLSLCLPCAQSTFDYDTNSKPTAKVHLPDDPTLRHGTVHTPRRQLIMQDCHSVVNVDRLVRCIKGLTSSVRLLMEAMHFGDKPLVSIRCLSENH